MNVRFSSLRSALLVPFVGLVVAVASAIGGLSYLTGARAVEAFSDQMLEDVSFRITQAISQHLATPKQALNTVAPDGALLLPGASAAMATIAPLSYEAIEQRQWLATGLFNDVSGYVYYGFSDGRFIGVNRSDAGTEVRAKETPSGPRIAYRSSGPGLRGDELRRDTYDSSTRPWYKTALERKRLAWSPIYVAATSKALTLTLAKPVFDTQNTFHGVVATDLPLANLDRFVSTLRTSKNGVAFIVDSRGELIATSSAEPLIKEERGAPTRIKAAESSSALIRDAYGSYASYTAQATSTEGNALTQPTPSQSIHSHFDLAGGTVDLATTRHSDSAGLDWTILVAIPRNDHMGTLRRTVLKNLAIGLTAVGLAIAIGLWLTQRIAHDIGRLSEATRLVASGQAPALEIRRDDEIGSIARSMAMLSSGLLNDPLTGTLNRSALEKRFNADFAPQSASPGSATGGARKTDTPGKTSNARQPREASNVRGAVVFLDLNGFKQVNDTHGHSVGDALLALTAQRLASSLRRTDAIARQGGDEFVMLLAVTDEAEVIATIERCRAQLAVPFQLAGQSLHVAAAFGYALIPRDGTNLNELISAADQSMYADKARIRAELLARTKQANDETG